MGTLCTQRGLVQSTLYDRVSQLLESVEWSDCSFRIGDEVIRAHRLILGISSPVFKVMLYGPMACTENILISDIEPEVFQLLLGFIYTDKVSIESLDIAGGLLYAAKKYIIPCLEEKCLAYIEDNVSIDNVLSIFEFSDWMQEKKLRTYCLKLICQHADLVFKSDLDKLSVFCLKTIVLQEKMNISEIDIIKAILSWARNICVERNLPPTKENRRRLLIKYDLLKNLRFFALPLLDYKDLIKDCDILLGDEVKAIEETINKKDNLNLNIKTLLNDTELCTKLEPRSQLGYDWYYCRRAIIRSASPLNIDETNNSINVRIKCQKTVFIDSFIIPTRMSPQISFSNECLSNYSEHVVVHVRSENEETAQKVTNFINTVDYNTSVIVNLLNTYIMKKDEWYTVTFSWPERICQSYKYPLCYRYNNCNHKVVFDFDDTSYDVNQYGNGSFLEGLKFCI